MVLESWREMCPAVAGAEEGVDRRVNAPMPAGKALQLAKALFAGGTADFNAVYALNLTCEHMRNALGLVALLAPARCSAAESGATNGSLSAPLLLAAVAGNHVAESNPAGDQSICGALQLVRQQLLGPALMLGGGGSPCTQDRVLAAVMGAAEAASALVNVQVQHLSQDRNALLQQQVERAGRLVRGVPMSTVATAALEGMAQKLVAGALLTQSDRAMGVSALRMLNSVTPVAQLAEAGRSLQQLQAQALLVRRVHAALAPSARAHFDVTLQRVLGEGRDAAFWAAVEQQRMTHPAASPVVEEVAASAAVVEEEHQQQQPANLAAAERPISRADSTDDLLRSTFMGSLLSSSDDEGEEAQEPAAAAAAAAPAVAAAAVAVSGGGDDGDDGGHASAVASPLPPVSQVETVTGQEVQVVVGQQGQQQQQQQHQQQQVEAVRADDEDNGVEGEEVAAQSEQQLVGEHAEPAHALAATVVPVVVSAAPATIIMQQVAPAAEQQARPITLPQQRNRRLAYCGLCVAAAVLVTARVAVKLVGKSKR